MHPGTRDIHFIFNRMSEIGWCDTPGVQTALPAFRKAMGSGLRTSEQGADTILWAGISKEVEELPSGSFLFDREIADQHLPGCFWWTGGGEGVAGLITEFDRLLALASTE